MVGEPRGDKVAVCLVDDKRDVPFAREPGKGGEECMWIKLTYMSGAMFIHPHPICHESMVLFMIGNSPSAYERLFHFFPIRTGISVPDWVMIGCDADRIGAAGLIGAG